jgi:hypothetical protein
MVSNLGFSCINLAKVFKYITLKSQFADIRRIIPGTAFGKTGRKNARRMQEKKKISWCTRCRMG